MKTTKKLFDELIVPVASIHGRKLLLRDQFVLETRVGKYLILVVQHVNFNGDMRHHKYEIISIDRLERVAPDSPEYQKLISVLPTLKKVSESGLVNVAKWRILAGKFDALLESLITKKVWTPREHASYFMYLNDMREARPASFRFVYSYFMGDKN